MIKKVLALLCASIISITMIGCSENKPDNKTPIKAEKQSISSSNKISLPNHNVLEGYYSKLEFDSPSPLSFDSRELQKPNEQFLEAKSRKAKGAQGDNKYFIALMQIDNYAFKLLPGEDKYTFCNGKEKATALSEQFLKKNNIDVRSPEVKEYVNAYKVRNINGFRAEEFTASFVSKALPGKTELKVVSFDVAECEWVLFFLYLKDDKNTVDCVESIISSMRLIRK